MKKRILFQKKTCENFRGNSVEEELVTKAQLGEGAGEDVLEACEMYESNHYGSIGKSKLEIPDQYSVELKAKFPCQRRLRSSSYQDSPTSEPS